MMLPLGNPSNSSSDTQSNKAGLLSIFQQLTTKINSPRQGSIDNQTTGNDNQSKTFEAAIQKQVETQHKQEDDELKEVDEVLDTLFVNIAKNIQELYQAKPVQEDKGGTDEAIKKFSELVEFGPQANDASTINKDSVFDLPESNHTETFSLSEDKPIVSTVNNTTENLVFVKTPEIPANPNLVEGLNGETISFEEQELSKLESEFQSLELVHQVSNIVEEKLQNHSDNLIKRITDIDLDSEHGVEQILEISGEIEEVKNITDQIKEILDKLNELNQTETIETEINLSQESETLIESKVSSFVEEIKKHIKNFKNQNREAEQTSPERQRIAALEEGKSLSELKEEYSIEKIQAKAEYRENKSLDEKEANLRNNTSLAMDLETSTEIDPELEQNESNIKLEFAKTKANGPALSNNKVKLIPNPVELEALPKFIAEEGANTKVGERQEIKLQLNPENLGELEIEINREGNDLQIKMTAVRDDAQVKLEQKAEDIKETLRLKGFETKVEVNKTNTGNNAEFSEQNREQSGHNEAKEEQKNRLLNSLPEWLYKNMNDKDFAAALEEII